MIRAFTIQAYSGLVAGTIMATGCMLGQIDSLEPMHIVAKMVTQAAGVVLAYGAGRYLHGSMETIASAMTAGFVAGNNPDHSLLIALTALTTLGTLGPHY